MMLLISGGLMAVAGVILVAVGAAQRVPKPEPCTRTHARLGSILWGEKTITETFHIEYSGGGEVIATREHPKPKNFPPGIYSQCWEPGCDGTILHKDGKHPKEKRKP